MRLVVVVAVLLITVVVAAAVLLPDETVNTVTIDGAAESARIEREATFLQRLEHLVAIIGFPAAIAGLVLIHRQLRVAQRAQRTASGPFVRVDLVPADVARLPDFRAEQPYFATGATAASIHPEAEGVVTIAAMFRNLQPSPLGVAYNVQASFVLTLQDAIGTESTHYWNVVRVPYLEHDKPVRLGLFDVSSSSQATATVASLQYEGLDGKDVRTRALSRDEPWHGRLVCRYDGSTFQAEPVFQPTED